MKKNIFMLIFFYLLCVSEDVYAITNEYVIDEKNIDLVEHSVECSQCRSFFIESNNLKYVNKLNVNVTLSDKAINILLNLFPFVSNVRFDSESEMNDRKAILFAYRHANRLTHLDISQNNIGNKGAKAIAQHFLWLISLDLSGNDIGDEGTKEIVENLEDLIFLDVSGNNISDDGIQGIADHLKKLNWLFIDQNYISLQGATSISKLKNLRSLKIANNNIRNTGILEIAKNAKKLTHLDVSHNNIGVLGAEIIAKYLTELESLNIYGNLIECDGAQSILDNLTKLKHFGIFAFDLDQTLNYRLLRSRDEVLGELCTLYAKNANQEIDF